MPHSVTLSQNLGPILGALRSVPVPPRPGEPVPLRADPFVTISRQVGAGAWPLAAKITDALNDGVPADAQRWTCWDRELVEKVAQDHHLARRLVEKFEDRNRSWLTDFFAAMATEGGEHYTDEVRIFRDVASTVRALAQAGRVVLVGRGSLFITHGMPAAVHVRLVAPLEKRIEHMARMLKVSQDEAARQVRELTRRRGQFYHRFWPNNTMRPDLFHVTLNTAAMSTEAAVTIVKDLVRDAVVAGAR